MKKIFSVAVLILFLFSWVAEAVTPLSDIDDVYVRKDVYQSDMRNLNEKIDNLDRKLDSLISDVQKLAQSVAALSERIEGVNNSLSEKIDGVNNSLIEKIEGTSTRVDDLQSGLYLAFTLVTVVASLPFLKKWHDEHAAQKLAAMKPAFTLDDVKKLIEENNAMLLSKLQGGAI